ncbi:anti-sigma factor [Cobetia crustatorum]|uniref:anti-sigma factor n=1 Tax=Cobetia crustatorum TaxID=553385 RepID=UPI00046966D5|nr:anti-sigma factor [Cobetia crustatorum]
MNTSLIPDTPEEQNLLLGEHTLGLLDPEREEEIRAWIARDDEAARMALRWQQHWLSVSDRLPPEPASDSLWKRIDASLTRLKQAPASAPTSREETRQPSWLVRWLGGGIGLGLGAGLALALAMQVGPFAPQEGIDTGTPDMAVQAPDTIEQRMVAVLQTLEDPGTPTWVAHVTTAGGLQLTPKANIERPSDRVIELWTLTDPTEGPRSLGLVDPVAGIELSAAQIGSMNPGQLLEMTLEPEGGSPTGKPTGKVLAIGRLVDLNQLDS